MRQATGREDIWGVGLPMSVASIGDTADQLVQFQLAYEAPWIGPATGLQVDDPEVRAGLVEALNQYTALWRKGCTPPDAVMWTNIDNNRAFLAQNVVMTMNGSLSIPGGRSSANGPMITTGTPRRSIGQMAPTASHSF